MHNLTFKQLDETLYTEELNNGLKVFILPKKGFNKTYATFTTKYGSIDNKFIPLNGSEPIKVPDGIAHFLEHKMFEHENGDVFQDFSKQGASANAFTSFTRTAYLFSSTSSVDKNLNTLIDFVQYPYFTEETVEKEKGIIEQEINMYEDNPDWQNFFGLLGTMYETHPVRTDIAGTAASISEITKDDLYTCYHRFYHPSNMVLFIVGNVEPEHVMKVVRENQASKSFETAEEPVRFYPEEREDVYRKATEIPMPVNIGKCLVGVKEKNPDIQGQDLLSRELSIQILLELIFGQSSENYQRLYSSGLIDDTFSFDYTAESGFGFSVIGGDSEDPEKLAGEIKKTIEQFKSEPFPVESFERIRKKKIGFFLRALNSPEYIANQFTRYRFNEMDLFDVIPQLEKIDPALLQEVLEDHFDLANQVSACFIVPERNET
ncbi:EF-P 5-aminopentanol modification-associated protein YfmH [Alkalicoccus daliensis]|uniref:Predicted Zn-dependent peptidase n=1 Tax=Alkalicoccus daliensis TaxID=745820 RepID=A0A1H0A9K1_9BACI|nr:pitrilysin family protein [Alkalicoccus daliensis]SDN29914.1 Predicted Zn-dependent peptidase [Alkalicoccus daliensis]